MPMQDSLSEYGLFFEGIDHLQGDCLEGLVWELEDRIGGQDSERLMRFFIGLTELSDRAKEIVRICLDCPRELEKVVGGKGRHVFLTKNDIRSYLYFNGWNHLEISWAFHEIELFLAKGFN